MTRPPAALWCTWTHQNRFCLAAGPVQASTGRRWEPPAQPGPEANSVFLLRMSCCSSANGLISASCLASFLTRFCRPVGFWVQHGCRSKRCHGDVGSDCLLSSDSLVLKQRESDQIRTAATTATLGSYSRKHAVLIRLTMRFCCDPKD